MTGLAAAVVRDDDAVDTMTDAEVSVLGRDYALEHQPQVSVFPVPAKTVPGHSRIADAPATVERLEIPEPRRRSRGSRITPHREPALSLSISPARSVYRQNDRITAGLGRPVHQVTRELASYGRVKL